MLPPPRVGHNAGINHLRAGLQTEDRAFVTSAIRIEHLLTNHVLTSRTDPVTDIRFPNNGIVALSVTDNEGGTGTRR